MLFFFAGLFSNGQRIDDGTVMPSEAFKARAYARFMVAIAPVCTFYMAFVSMVTNVTTGGGSVV